MTHSLRHDNVWLLLKPWTKTISIMNNKSSIFFHNLPNVVISDHYQLVLKVNYLVVIEIIFSKEITLRYFWNIIKVDDPDSLWLSFEILIETTTKDKIVGTIIVIRLKQGEASRTKFKIHFNLIPRKSTVLWFKILIYLSFVCVWGTSCNEEYNFIICRSLWFSHWRTKQTLW